MTTLLNGVVGGLVVGFVAAVGLKVADNVRSAPATGPDEPADAWMASRWGQLAVWSLYGSIAGGVFLALELYVLAVLGVPPTWGAALGVAIGWSLVLVVLWGIVGWSLPSRLLDGSDRVDVLVYHAIYGVGFGVWIRLTWIT